MKLKDSILEKIKQEEVIPEAKWKIKFFASFPWFIMWFFLSLTIFIAFIFFREMQFSVQDEMLLHDWNFFKWEKFIFFWFLLLIVFIFLSYFSFRKTKRGYIFDASHIILILSLINIVWASVLFLIPGPDRIHEEVIFSWGMSAFSHIGNWMNPEEWKITGKVLWIKKDYFTIKTPDGDVWKIMFWEISLKKIEKGVSVKIIGYKIKEDSFFAKDIFILPRRNIPQRDLREKQKKDSLIKDF